MSLKENGTGPDTAFTYSFVEKFQPRILTFQGLLMPLGDVSEILGPGYSASVTGDFLLPFFNPNDDGFKFRVGIEAGLLLGFSKRERIRAMVTVLPFTGFFEASYYFNNRIRPYAYVGGGMSFGFMHKHKHGDPSINKKTLDTTVSGGLGAGYTFAQVPGIEFFLGCDYKLLFENINGHFLSFRIGAAYRFHVIGGSDAEF